MSLDGDCHGQSCDAQCFAASGSTCIRCVGLSPGTVATEFQRQIKSAGTNPVSRLDWSAHIPPEWAAEAVALLTTDDAREHDGGDFSIKTDEERAAVGLPGLSNGTPSRASGTSHNSALENVCLRDG